MVQIYVHCMRLGSRKESFLFAYTPHDRHRHRAAVRFFSSGLRSEEGLPSVFVRSRPPRRPGTRRFWRENGKRAGGLIPSAREPVVRRTHFPFGVNHVEVYNNIKFPFTRFAGSALFLRQKTHSPPRWRRVFILRNVNDNVFTECVRFFFLLVFSLPDNINRILPIFNNNTVYIPFSISLSLSPFQAHYLHLNDSSVSRYNGILYIVVVPTYYYISTTPCNSSYPVPGLALYRIHPGV